VARQPSFAEFDTAAAIAGAHRIRENAMGCLPASTAEPP